MALAQYIRQIATPDNAQRGLSEADAHDLLAVLLDGGASDLEVGAALMGLRMRDGFTSELAGFQRALGTRTYGLRPPAACAKPLVFATCNGVREEANLLPLLALMLQRLGVPVLMHGAMEGDGGVASVYVLRKLGILPSASLVQAQMALEAQRLAFVPTAVLCPALASLLALRHTLGTSNVAHTIVKLVDPFPGEGVRVIGATRRPMLGQIETVIAGTNQEALLLQATEGEPFANPRRRPRIVYVREGKSVVLFEEEAVPAREMMGLPKRVDAAATARWIAAAMSGQAPVPYPLVNQLACCLYASRYTEDMNQAKAIAAVEAGGLGPAPGPRKQALTMRDRFWP